MTKPDAPSLASTLAAGLAGRCPACGRGKLFSGYLALAPRCDVCGLDYSFAEAGDGPAVFVILFTGAYPQGLYEFGVGALRWRIRVEAYMLLMVDEYPPFSLT